jgi:hypothetical protein
MASIAIQPKWFASFANKKGYEVLNVFTRYFCNRLKPPEGVVSLANSF